MKKIYSIFFLTFVLASIFVLAEVNERNEVFLGEIIGGELSYTDTEINYVNVVGVICSNLGCSSIDGYLWNDDTLFTGSNNRITLVYPTELQSPYGYQVHFFKEGYIPSSFEASWSGTGTTPSSGYYDNYLFRKDVCEANINTINFNRGEILEGETIEIDVNVEAPLNRTMPTLYIPAELEDYYQTRVEVLLEIENSLGDVVYNESREVNIPFGENLNLVFSWQASETGNYDANIYTSVPDPQCLSDNRNIETNSFFVNDSSILNNFTIDFNANLLEGTVPLNVVFSGSVSDTNGNNLSCNLNFGDGNSTFVDCNGFNIEHTYETVGFFGATLIVSDGVEIASEILNIQVNPSSDNYVWFTYPTTSNGFHSQNNIVANVSANETNLNLITIYLYNVTGLVESINTSNSNLHHIFENLSEGEYYLNASAEYSTENHSTETRNIALDKTAPQINYILPENNAELDTSRVEFEYSINDTYGLKNISLYINGVLINTHDYFGNLIAENNFLISLDDGNYEWYIECYDMAGNRVVSETREFNVEDKGIEGSSSERTIIIDTRTFSRGSLIEGISNHTIDLNGKTGKKFEISFWIPLFLLLAILLILILIYLLNRNFSKR